MNHQDVLMNAAIIVNQRQSSYGDVDFMFETAAQIASLITGELYTKYDITTVMEAVKLARRRVNPRLDDNYVDGINYTAFSAQFAGEAFTVGTPTQPTEKEDNTAVAKRSSSDNEETSNEKVSVRFDGNGTFVAVNPSNGS